MGKQIIIKVNEAEDFLKNGTAGEREDFLEYMSRWIGYFQHERFVHLMVTLFFALYTMVMLFAFIYFNNILWGLLFLIFGVTTCFYIRHYYLLENKTQYLYSLYDRISKKQDI